MKGHSLLVDDMHDIHTQMELLLATALRLSCSEVPQLPIYQCNLV